MSLVIRPLTIDELPLCVPFAQEFHEELKLPGKMIPEIFMKNWTTFLTTYPSVILSLWKEEVLLGGLGAMIVPDLFDGRLCGHEMFIFIRKSERGGSGFLRLLKAFRAWWIERGAVEGRLAHMEHAETDEALDRLYRKLGYRPIERSYVESLCQL